MNNQKGFINVLVIIVVLAVIGVGGYYLISQKGSWLNNPTPENNQNHNLPVSVNNQQNENAQQPTSPTGTQQAPPPSYSGSLKTYKNSKFGFEIKYPASLKVEEGKIEPNTYFVVWKNPNYNNVRVNIIYINDGKSALTNAELAKGTSAKIGTKSGYKFTFNANPLYWIDVGNYALAIYFEKPQNSGSNYNEYVDISSFKF